MKPVEYQNILAVDHLEKGYNYISSKGEEVSCPVLENISFQIEPKEFVGIMGRSGCGKTTLLSALINRMKERLRIGEMDVDIETSLDAQRVADLTGVESIQIHNCGLCHIDADMVSRALLEYDTENLDLLILENIGNLVCPAEFDTGAHKNVMLLSVPEGDLSLIHI